MDIDSWNFISFDTSTPQVAQDNVIELSYCELEFL